MIQIGGRDVKMPMVGFEINSVGVGPMARTDAVIAVQEGRGVSMARGVYVFGSAGGAGFSRGPLLLGHAETTEPAYLPDRNQAGQVYPPVLQGKKMKIVLGAGSLGPSLGTGGDPIDVEFTIKELRGGREWVELYKVEVPVHVFSAFPTGVAVEDTVQRYAGDEIETDLLYQRIM
jgi:hypothetical protein